ncbi:MAG: hypothetical protein ACYC1M_00495 [Armatimonadota bacterium]
MNRSLLTAALAALVIAAPVFSQTNTQPAAAQRRPAMASRQPQMQLRRLSQALSLTTDQIAKVKELMKAEAPKVLRIRNDAQKKIQAVLTPDQIKKYQEIVKSRASVERAGANASGANAADQNAKPKRQARNAAQTAAPAAGNAQMPKPGQRVDQLRRLVQELGLTTAQTDLIKPILKAQAALLKTVREDTQKKIVAILTPEQAEKYKSMLEAQAAAVKAGQSNAEKPKTKAVKPAKRNKTNSGF